MIKLTWRIFMSSKNFLEILFKCTKMSKNSSGKFYQQNKERLHKKACETCQSISKEEKEKK